MAENDMLICQNCKNELPRDSGFCQYCGSKIETPIVENNSSKVEIKEEPLTDEVVAPVVETEMVAQILDSGIVEEQKAMEANRENQPHNELDADFGLVPQKPIYTVGIDEQEKYLKSLRTISGESINYNRRGSMSVDGINGMVDVYDTYLPSGEEYKTIYINMYGASNSTFAPKGFSQNNASTQSGTMLKKGKKPKTKYCSHCGSKIDNQTKICPGCGKKYFRGIKINRFSITVTIFILIIITSMTLNIIQYNKIDYLSWRETYLQNRVNKLEADVSDLEDVVSNLEDEKWDNWFKLRFFDNYAEIVGDDGTNVYHKYGCSRLDTSDGFWIYNTGAAKNRRYSECPFCH